jgi:DNA-binding Lrp family transcriptional regulator
VNFLENVFVDISAEISGQNSRIEAATKPKRNAFVFITTDNDDSPLAVDDLRKIDGVKEVYVAHGAYDIVAKVSGESYDHLREIIQSRIRNLSNIKSTLTLTEI